MTGEINQDKIEKLYSALDKWAVQMDFRLNPDKPFVYELLNGLLTNELRYGYRSRPCRLTVGTLSEDKDIRCPCIAYMKDDVKEYGACFCELFVSIGRANGTQKRVVVPDRRPPKF